MPHALNDERAAPRRPLAFLRGRPGSARHLGRRWWSVIPTHVQYFTRESIATLLGRAGFRIVEVSTAPKIFSVRYYLKRVAGYRPAVASGLVRLAETIGIAGRQWGPDFRDRMLVIARSGPDHPTLSRPS